MSTMMVGHRPHSHLAFCHNQLPHSLRSSPEHIQDEAMLATITTNGAQYTPFLLPQTDLPLEKALGYGAFGVVWCVIDPRDGKKVALKRIPRVFHSTVTAKRVYRELIMLSSIQHDNIICLTDVVKSDSYLNFDEIYILCEFMQTDLHKIIVSPQPLSSDHVKIFVYQILRGLKYLHSARIIHRDIKPGNMLVNSNCLLKICDFGLARVEDPLEQVQLTHEVVTQYYRPPELLMNVDRYSYEVDIWSVGCTFAELLGRRILFQARDPEEQLELILNVTGTPNLTDMRHTHSEARGFIVSCKSRLPNPSILYNLGPNVTDQAVHLLSLMLKFNPDSRISAAAALTHPYLEEARLRFHSCMCSCCVTEQTHSLTPQVVPSVPATGGSSGPSQPLDLAIGRRRFTADLDPVCATPLPHDLDSSFRRLSDAKKILWETVQEYHRQDDRPYRVVLNRNGRNYKALMTSNVAQAKEVPATHRWH